MTLKQEVEERMRAAPMREMSDEEAFHLLNNPSGQVGAAEKFIGQKYVTQES